jgi:hypothetical protein
VDGLTHLKKMYAKILRSVELEAIAKSIAEAMLPIESSSHAILSEISRIQHSDKMKL